MPTATLKCCYCKERKPRETMLITPKGAFCDDGHAYKYGIEGAIKREKQEARKQKKRFKDNDYRHQFKLTKRTAQRLANLLDAERPCISCSAPRSSGIQFCGGHMKTAGGNPEIALDLRNIHGQCNRRCNKALSGNIEGTKDSAGYKAGLTSRYGPAALEWLESYHPPRKYTCEELIEIRAIYAAEIRHIQEHGVPSREWRSFPSKEAAA